MYFDYFGLKKKQFLAQNKKNKQTSVVVAVHRAPQMCEGGCGAWCGEPHSHLGAADVLTVDGHNLRRFGGGAAGKAPLCAFLSTLEVNWKRRLSSSGLNWQSSGGNNLSGRAVSDDGV